MSAPSSTSTAGVNGQQQQQQQQEVDLQRSYAPFLTLKYGVNPHQKPALLATPTGSPPPFRVLNGVPGYINVLDALNAWQLVKELREATGLAAAASFKHVSPAGAAVAVQLDPQLAAVYDVGELQLTPSALAYLRARQTDPKCMTGDHTVLTRSGFRSLAVIYREFAQARASGVLDPVIEVSSLNQDTHAMEWKRVEDAQRFPAGERDHTHVHTRAHTHTLTSRIAICCCHEQVCRVNSSSAWRARAWTSALPRTTRC